MGLENESNRHLKHYRKTWRNSSSEECYCHFANFGGITVYGGLNVLPTFCRAAKTLKFRKGERKFSKCFPVDKLGRMKKIAEKIENPVENSRFAIELFI